MAGKTDTSPEKMQELMDNINFFHGFSRFEKKACAASASSIARFEPGSEIIEEGGNDTFFYIILSGTVKIIKKNVEINILREGDFFGEMAFLANTARSSSAVAESRVLTYRLNQEKMKLLQGSIREKIKDQCIIKLVERADQLTEKMRVRM